MGIQTDKTFDCFICHCGDDTKTNIAGLIYSSLKSQEFHHPFLDEKSLNIGESGPQKIKEAIHGCTIGIVLFSPGFCNSKDCLNELVLLLKMNKQILPIFWNIQPSELVKALKNNNQLFPKRDLQRYRTAINKASKITGTTFRSDDGDWAKLLGDTLKAVDNIYSKCQKDSPKHSCHKIKLSCAICFVKCR